MIVLAVDCMGGDHGPGVTLPACRQFLDRHPEAKSYADWLRQRMDYLVMAAEVLREDRAPPAPPAPGKVPAGKPASPPPTRKAPTTIVPPPAKPAPAATPAAAPAKVSRADQKAMDVDRWVRKIEKRPPPARASRYVPLLKPIFRQEGVPEQLVWLAEVESSFDPAARSPVGALGLYQFMPATAQRFGLSLKPDDERLVPERSAVAAAKYLRFLHGRFQSWPLALAAYNAGEGRVGKLMSSRKATTFEGIADHLPAETRMYVPKVAAVVKVREGADLTRL